MPKVCLIALTIHAGRAYLHNYGVEVRLEDVESGQVLVRLRARRDPEGRALRR